MECVDTKESATILRLLKDLKSFKLVIIFLREPERVNTTLTQYIDSIVLTVNTKVYQTTVSTRVQCSQVYHLGSYFVGEFNIIPQFWKLAHFFL